MPSRFGRTSSFPSWNVRAEKYLNGLTNIAGRMTKQLLNSFEFWHWLINWHTKNYVLKWKFNHFRWIAPFCKTAKNNRVRRRSEALLLAAEAALSAQKKTLRLCQKMRANYILGRKKRKLKKKNKEQQWNLASVEKTPFTLRRGGSGEKSDNCGTLWLTTGQ